MMRLPGVEVSNFQLLHGVCVRVLVLPIEE